MEDISIDKESGVSEIFRFVKEYHDNPAKNGIRDLYDTVTPSYDQTCIPVLSFQTVRGILYSGPNKVVSILNEYRQSKSISILDCGAGTGLVGEQLHASGYRNVIGVDVSQKSLDVAKQKGVYKKLICAEIVPQGMHFSDGEFDVLTCCGCIVPGHISPKCFPEWTRIVKPGEPYLKTSVNMLLLFLY
ncbi:Methyltransferase-like protein 27 [Holothuria leucospilota]|uniref:Methyltransferase-like protein 27 n=1 Tax=Holothuria leucospilota TaxID=206669 RepID=A0A9Q1BVV4_HOLLE|nr:Methyltransferase-like protein 27 [Holothuria leucospilota]